MKGNSGKQNLIISSAYYKVDPNDQDNIKLPVDDNKNPYLTDDWTTWKLVGGDSSYGVYTVGIISGANSVFITDSSNSEYYSRLRVSDKVYTNGVTTNEYEQGGWEIWVQSTSTYGFVFMFENFVAQTLIATTTYGYNNVDWEYNALDNSYAYWHVFTSPFPNGGPDYT